MSSGESAERFTLSVDSLFGRDTPNVPILRQLANLRPVGGDGTGDDEALKAAAIVVAYTPLVLLVVNVPAMLPELD